MGFISAIQTSLRKYVTFSGRASRSEFWWFMLFNLLCLIGSAIISAQIDPSAVTATTGEGSVNFEVNSPVSGIIMLLLTLPTISVTVRRLHDTARSGWWYFIALIPLIGQILLLIWMCSKGTSGDNRLGSDLLAPAA